MPTIIPSTLLPALVSCVTMLISLLNGIGIGHYRHDCTLASHECAIYRPDGSVATANVDYSGQLVTLRWLIEWPALTASWGPAMDVPEPRVPGAIVAYSQD